MWKVLMEMFIPLIISVLLAIPAALCSIYAIYQTMKILSGVKASRRKQIIVAILMGISFDLILLALLLWFVEPEEIYKARYVIIVVILSLSLVIPAGTYLRFYIVGKGYEYLYQKYGQKRGQDD
jgi:hypothetical protein